MSAPKRSRHQPAARTRLPIICGVGPDPSGADLSSFCRTRRVNELRFYQSALEKLRVGGDREVGETLLASHEHFPVATPEWAGIDR